MEDLEYIRIFAAMVVLLVVISAIKKKLSG
jgi:hypothetical protein